MPSEIREYPIRQVDSMEYLGIFLDRRNYLTEICGEYAR
jgi:hypothetical protein